METAEKNLPESRPIRLPGFLNDRDIGMGDVIKRGTSYFGIPPCGGCQKRASELNGRFVFSARSRNKRS